MFGSEILEVALGVTLLFLLVSLICSAASEALEAIVQARGRNLERGIAELLRQAKGGDVGKFYQHDLIAGLFQGEYVARGSRWWDVKGWWARRRLPSYIPANLFASAIIDTVLRDPAGLTRDGGGEATKPAAPKASRSKDPAEQLRAAAEVFENGAVRTAVMQAVAKCGGDIEKAKKSLEAWFNGSMDRVSGWYKRRTQLILVLLVLSAAEVLNLDVITVTERLTRDRALRAAVVAAADTIAVREADLAAQRTEESLQSDAFDDRPADEAVAASSARIATLKSDLQTIGYPMGWRGGLPGPQREIYCGATGPCGLDALGWLGFWTRVLLGWLVLALAVMLGAPFWFDVLNKIMVIRSTVKPTEKSPDEGSEDRRPKTPRP